MQTTGRPRYVVPYKKADGTTVWRFLPPAEYVEAGVVKRVNLGTDHRSAYAAARKLNKIVDDYRAGKITGTTPRSISTFTQVVSYYYTTDRFKRLTGAIQKRYEYMWNIAAATVVDGRIFGTLKIQDITVRHCTLAYEQWVERGIVTANDIRTICSVLFNYAISLDIVSRNPMAYVRAISTKPRRVKWTKDHLQTFLTTAYSDFKYRNIGMLVHMCYEWCQRVGDIRKLTWDAIDFDSAQVTILQSKRGATVYLPITAGLLSMLQQQKQDFGFQTYVVPNPTRPDKAYKPYAETHISRLVREVKQIAGLPNELQAWDLRRTGITEMVEAGADLAQIMQVSGHASPNSVTPYLVNTYRGAKTAMSLRFEEFQDA